MTTFQIGPNPDTDTNTPLAPTVYDYSPNTTATTSHHSASDDSDDDEDNLPYPADLARRDFLTEDFDPQTYLSSLRNRHQTLEDLRSDLRQRSQLLNQELLDLVNNNYEEFLSLGADLKGGEEKVEGVRVGLLGFEREVEVIKRVVEERMNDVGKLLEERKAVRRDVVFGRGLVEIETGIGDLEVGMGIVEDGGADQELDLEDEDEDDEERRLEGDTATIVPVRKLRRHTQQYLLLSRSIARLGADHPFLQAQLPRMAELRRTLLLDLGSALRQAKAAKAQDTVLTLLRMHADLGAEQESVRALKGG